jgi:Pregnancy-associated plasma protein-A
MAAPKRRACGSMEVNERLAETFASLRQNQSDIEAFTVRSMQSGFAERVARKLVTIPVVVHVVYKKDEENVSNGQIKSQIAVLNADFRAKNPDAGNVPGPWSGFVADAKVEFKLATKDPKGRKTNGITRTKTTRSSFGTDDSVKTTAGGGHAAWPAARYLNLWVCNLGGGLLGYAQFPGGPAKTDGVVILHSAVGTSGTATAPFNLGRTTTHEVGHWLNLRHIWGDQNDCSGTDFVSDTPNAQLPNFGTPSFPHVSCDNGPNGDMFMNYMDYVDDVAMFMFTPAQVIRMNATLAGPRSKIGR